jgi:hypothetical protein
LPIDGHLVLRQRIVRKSAICAVEDVAQEEELTLAEIMSP